jgi:glutathione S-transferase
MSAYTIHGAPGSPYSIKVRSAFRYKRIPHIWKMMGPGNAQVMTRVKVPVIPVVEFPDGGFANDSTPLLIDIDRRHPARSIIPDDPALAFMCFLIEDFADEWCTKAMFHYRWYRAADQDQMSKWLAFDRMMGQGAQSIEAAAQIFRERQIGRMAIVGCTPQNAPAIEDSTFAMWRLLDALTVEGPYLFGSRPSLADFALQGQYIQLATDPTPQTLMRATAPYLYRWLFDLDDASGVEGRWHPDLDMLHPSVHGILRQVGDIYLPFLIANDSALEQGRDSVDLTLMGRQFAQGTFKYQQKCLKELRARYAALTPEVKERLDPVLGAAHCLKPLKG